MLGACTDSPPTATLSPADEVLHELLVTPMSLTMAVGDKVSLSAIARSITGDTLSIPADDPIVWKSLDDKIVSVDADGVMEALAPNENFVNVTATWQHGGTTKSTTVSVNVTAVRYPVAHLEFIPDSARTGLAVYTAWTGLTVNAVDRDGAFLMLPRVQFEIHDTLGNVLSMDNSAIVFEVEYPRYVVYATGRKAGIGKFWVVASSIFYGTFIRDSIPFLGLYPADAQITIDRDSVARTFRSVFKNKTLEVQPCASVTFMAESQVPIDIIFDDPSLAVACTPQDTEIGNILGLRGGYEGQQTRRFRAVGRRTWSVRNSVTGAMIPGLTGFIDVREP